MLLAGRRALGLDVAVALGLIEQALGLAPSGEPARAEILEAYGDGLVRDGRYGDAVAAHEEALQLFRESGQVPEAADVMGRLSAEMEYMGDPRGPVLMREAIALLEPIGDTPQLARAILRARVI